MLPAKEVGLMVKRGANSSDNGTFPNVIGMFIHGLIPHEIAAVTKKIINLYDRT